MAVAAMVRERTECELGWCEPDCPNFVEGLVSCDDCTRLNHEIYMDEMEESDFRFHWSFCDTDELLRLTKLTMPEMGPKS